MTADDLLQIVATLQRVGMTFRAPEPDRWQAWNGDHYGTEPEGVAPPDGFVPAGPWEPIGAGLANGRQGGGPEDMESFVYWRRPLRAVTTG